MPARASRCSAVSARLPTSVWRRRRVQEVEAATTIFNVGDSAGIDAGRESRAFTSSHTCIGSSANVRTCEFRNVCLDRHALQTSSECCRVRACATDDNAGSGSRRLLYFMDPEAEPFDVIPPEEAVHLASSSPYPRYIN